MMLYWERIGKSKMKISKGKSIKRGKRKNWSQVKEKRKKKEIK